MASAGSACRERRDGVPLAARDRHHPRARDRRCGGAAVIVLLWHRWVELGQARWLALALVLLDVFLGTWLIKWEIEFIREVWQ